MTSANLENLAKIGQLKKEPPDRVELAGLLQAGRDKRRTGARIKKRRRA